MTVSIIIPNKDCPFIQNAIDSVLNQTYKNWELTIVFDNCSDAYLESLNDFLINLTGTSEYVAGKISFLYKNDNNPSIPSARNAGLKKARGEWIAYLSADDIWHPEFLEKTLETAVNQKVKFLYTDYNRINSLGEIIGMTKEFVFENQEDLTIHLFRRCCIMMSAILIHRDVFDKVGNFDEEILYGEDYLFYLKAAKYFELFHLPEVLVDYRIHGGQMTAHGKNAEYDIIIKEKAREYWGL